MTAEPVDAVLHQRVAELEADLKQARAELEALRRELEALRAPPAPAAEDPDLTRLKREHQELLKLCTELTLRQKLVPAPPRPYGGQKAGDRCYCSPDARLEEEMSAGLYSGLLQSFLFCPRCKFARRADGAIFCPTCVNFPASWVGGTDHDPRPECGTCGTIQPGWGPLEPAP